MHVGCCAGDVAVDSPSRAAHSSTASAPSGSPAGVECPFRPNTFLQAGPARLGINLGHSSELNLEFATPGRNIPLRYMRDVWEHPVPECRAVVPLPIVTALGRKSVIGAQIWRSALNSGQNQPVDIDFARMPHFRSKVQLVRLKATKTIWKCVVSRL